MSGVFFILFVLVACLPVYVILRRGKGSYLPIKAALIGALSGGVATGAILLAVQLYWLATAPGGTYLGVAPPKWVLLNNTLSGAVFGLMFLGLWKAVTLSIRIVNRIF
jgi:hypothetical protein